MKTATVTLSTWLSRLCFVVAKSIPIKTLFPATPTAHRALPAAPASSLATSMGLLPAARLQDGAFRTQPTPLFVSAPLIKRIIIPLISFSLFLRTSHSSPVADRLAASPLGCSSKSQRRRARLCHVALPVRYYARLQNQDRSRAKGWLAEGWEHISGAALLCIQSFCVCTSPLVRGQQSEEGEDEDPPSRRGAAGSPQWHAQHVCSTEVTLTGGCWISICISLLPPAAPEARGHLHNPTGWKQDGDAAPLVTWVPNWEGTP